VGTSQHAPLYASGGSVLLHSTATHVVRSDSGHYYGRSDYASRKDAEYRIKYGFKFVFLSLLTTRKCNVLCRYGVGAPEHLFHGPAVMNEELDEYIHSSGTGFKQWLRRRKARKEVKRAVQCVPDPLSNTRSLLA
jgi:hypothetical protein